MASKDPISESVSAGFALTQMMAEANWVIGMRMLGMMGMWNLGPREHQRMWSEKLHAAHASGTALAGAIMTGATPAGALEAAIRPIGRKTSANAKRLASRGPFASGRG